MTAAEFARLLNAKRVGRGKWVAKCVAHPDRRPSLSIAEGKQGVLVKCMSMGCDTRAILDAMGLRWKDLFYGERADPEALRKLHEKQRREEYLERKKRLRVRSALDRAALWEAVSRCLGGHLATSRSDERLAALFHESLDSMRRYEAEADTLDASHVRGLGFPERREIRSSEVPKEIADRLGIKDVLYVGRGRKTHDFWR